MPQTTSPFVLNDVSLTLILSADAATGTAEEYMCQLNRAELTPSAQSTGSEYETFCATFPAPAKTASWVLDLSGFQAYADATDLSLFLFDHEGEKAEFVLQPQGGAASATNPGFEGVVTLSPTAIGGTANQYAVMTASLNVDGKPVKVVA